MEISDTAGREPPAGPDPSAARDLLFQPGSIGPVALRNRIVMPPMTTRSSDEEGFVTDDTIAYYRARAAAGVGLVTVEMASPEKVGRHRFRELGVCEDRFIPGLSRLVGAIHDAGSRAAIQLGHGGGHTRVDVCGEQPIAPSAIPHPVFEGILETVVPREMSGPRIEQCVEAFVKAALRAKEAGFDAVEIHAAHGYLLSQFLCPWENRRGDEYGGSLENRARFPLEIVRRTKARAPELALVFRLNGDDFFPGGMSLGEARRVSVWAAAAGADAIHVTAGHYRSLPSAAVMIPPMAMGYGPFLEFARAVRADVDVPVIAVGRLGDADVAAAALARGWADFVAVGRPLLADPLWPRRVREGRPVRVCLGCNTCVDEMRAGSPLRCLVNPAAGRESHFEALAARRPRAEKIAVLGAGPAGLSYASIVSEDNEVTVFDKAPRPGGAFLQVAKAPLFQAVEPRAYSFDAFIVSLERQCREHGATFRYGVNPLNTPGALARFDRVVVATGATYRGGLGPLLNWLLDSGALRAWPLRALARRPRLLDWFYQRARSGTGKVLSSLLPAGVAVQVIGDAACPGKSDAAIASAFEAAHAPDTACPRSRDETCSVR